MECFPKWLASVITQDAPQVRLWLDDCFDFHNEFENIDALVSGIVESFNSNEQLDNVFTRDLTVVIKKDAVTDIWANHISVQHTDSRFRSRVEILQHVFIQVSCTLMPQSSLSVVAFHVTED